MCGIVDVCLQFENSRDGAISFVNSNFTRDPDKWISLTGYVFIIGSCAINWKATLQFTVALSIIEVEYIMITKAIKESIWLKRLIGEITENLQNSSVYCDS